MVIYTLIRALMRERIPYQRKTNISAFIVIVHPLRLCAFAAHWNESLRLHGF